LSLTRKPNVVLALGAMLALGLILLSGMPTTAQETNATYTNPVSKDFADAFPDPAIIKGKDGYWYAYGTTDPTRQSFGDNSFHELPMARSKDMVDWEYLGDVFSDANRPDWHPDEGALYWAPDVRYLNGRYYLYYSMVKFGPDGFATIGVVTAPTPTGPWTDSGGPVIEQGACRTNNIDPAEFTDRDGTRYLYWGSYGDICVAKMNAEATRVVGPAERVSYGGQAEAAYVVRHGDYYYLFISEGGCCSGPFSSYEVFVGRSESPMGPFVDREGISLEASRRGGTIVLANSGNKWVGPGHHSQTTDLSGQDWMVYHAIDKNDPYLEEPWEFINRRPLMIDRLDWIDGWPTVRAGAWASEDPQPAPVATPAAGGDFNGISTLDANWRREGAARDGWRLAHDRDSGGYARQAAPAAKPAYLVSRAQAPADVRAEADLRLPADSGGAAGLVAAYRDKNNHLAAWLDAGQRVLVTDVLVNGRSAGKVRTPLPAGFRFGDWHNVAVEVRGQKMSVSVTDARMSDPLATQTRTLPAGAGGPGSVGAASLSARSGADNVVATPLYQPVTEKVSDPMVGPADPAYSDEFDDGSLDPAWSWVRQPAGEETGGAYVWPTQSADLYGNIDNASVLLRDAPEGAYTVETKLGIDLGTDTVRNYQQAGLVVYGDDDRYLKLVHVAIGEGRRTEYAKEDGPYGAMMVGPPAKTTWLRVQHKIDPENGEHEFRAATSRDGERWIWGGVWTFPADTDWRIGLVSMGGSGATAEFDYVRVYRP
jgi:arabinan endo-1,5-alpha-L-arabinosidase